MSTSGIYLWTQSYYIFLLPFFLDDEGDITEENVLGSASDIEEADTSIGSMDSSGKLLHSSILHW